MPSLLLHQGDGQARILCAGGALLSDLLKGAGVFLPMPCAGNHSCGKCIVYTKGHLSAPSPQEMALLKLAAPGPDGFVPRLACEARLLGDCECLPNPSTPMQTLYIQRELALPDYDGERPGLGFMADIGTTTISAVLFRLETRESLGTLGQHNRQAAFGADVLSRIEYANRHGVAQLQEAILAQLNDMLDALLDKSGQSRSQVVRLSLTGNSVMLHLLLGLDVQSLGVYPFAVVSRFGQEQPAQPLFAGLHPDATLYLPPCISAFVGADLVCGIHACALDENSLLVDVGTNGEMALQTKDGLLCCSTAAGPAFEGANIHMGMAATPGAICDVWLEDGRIRYQTIADAPAKGICGTGIISAIGVMLEGGILGGGGEIRQSGHGFAGQLVQLDGQPAFLLGDSQVLLTQKDIRNIQLAKAAICAGIQTLLHEAGLAPSKVRALYLSGGFGTAIDPAKAAGIGLLPKALLPQTKALGNTAAQGAAFALFDRGARASLSLIQARATELPLSTNPFFMDQYIENMLFYEED